MPPLLQTFVCAQSLLRPSSGCLSDAQMTHYRTFSSGAKFTTSTQTTSKTNVDSWRAVPVHAEKNVVWKRSNPKPPNCLDNRCLLLFSWSFIRTQPASTYGRKNKETGEVRGWLRLFDSGSVQRAAPLSKTESDPQSPLRLRSSANNSNLRIRAKFFENNILRFASFSEIYTVLCTVGAIFVI